jgi:hypothetical protein
MKAGTVVLLSQWRNLADPAAYSHGFNSSGCRGGGNRGMPEEGEHENWQPAEGILI